ncbi:MAG: protein kinase [Deltaproteobacteria bacterium]|nr:protein kinase [Deltaproteobacteria bacterium]
MLACPRCGSTYVRDVVFCGLDGERLEAVDQDPLIGKTIDRYQVEDIIGDGGMARVYRARHVHLGQPCALKILYGDMAGDRTLAERFRREAQSSAQIRHPNVVQVTDFGASAEGLTFMAMELLEGTTLADRLKEERVLAPVRIADIARQIALGLSAAHAQGFVHRDLKPKNVMLVPEPGMELVKILDFGLVRPLEESDERLTAQGQVFGTPPYMSPEQISGGPIDPRTDLYALGAIIYELIAGHPPFQGAMADVFRKHLSVAPPPLTEKSGLGELAMVLLAKSPDARPGTAIAVVELIDSLQVTHISGTPEAPAPASSSGPPRPAPRAPTPKAASSRPPATPDPAPRKTATSGPARRGPPDPLGVELFDSLELNEHQIRSMVQRARPSLLAPLLIGSAFIVGIVAAALFLSSADPRALWQEIFEPSTPAIPAPAPARAPETSPAPAAPAGTPAIEPPISAETSPTETATAAVIDAPASGPPPPHEISAPAAVSPAKPPAPVGVSPAKPAAPVETVPPPAVKEPEPPPVDTGATFEALDRGLLWTLSQRGLNLRDLSTVERDAAMDWMVWQQRPSEVPEGQEMVDAYDALAAAARKVVVDEALLRAKLERVRRGLDRIPAGSRSESFRTLEGRWAVLSGELGRAREAEARQRLATGLTLLESEVEGLPAH